MSTDLNLKVGSLDSRTGIASTDLRIGQYEFFTNESESRYIMASENEQAIQLEMRDEIFTPAFPKGEDISMATQAQTMNIFNNSPEYTQGFYDETNAFDTGGILLVLLFVCVCILTFIVTRFIHMYKARKANECTLQ